MLVKCVCAGELASDRVCARAAGCCVLLGAGNVADGECSCDGLVGARFDCAADLGGRCACGAGGGTGCGLGGDVACAAGCGCAGGDDGVGGALFSSGGLKAGLLGGVSYANGD